MARKPVILSALVQARYGDEGKELTRTIIRASGAKLPAQQAEDMTAPETFAGPQEIP